MFVDWMINVGVFVGYFEILFICLLFSDFLVRKRYLISDK